jgi:hypothetical protein
MTVFVRRSDISGCARPTSLKCAACVRCWSPATARCGCRPRLSQSCSARIRPREPGRVFLLRRNRRIAGVAWFFANRHHAAGASKPSIPTFRRDIPDRVDFARSSSARKSFTHRSSKFSRRGSSLLRYEEEESALRLIRALAVEIHEDWIEAHRYLNMEMLREQRKQLQLLEAA